MYQDFIPLDALQFSKMVGDPVDSLPDETKKILLEKGLSYRSTKKEEQNRLILDLLLSLEKKRFVSSGSEQQAKWERCWGERLDTFLRTKNISDLIPVYYAPDHFVRINKEYVFSENGNITFDFFQAFRAWILLKFLKDKTSIFEFGCGPGHNLIAMNKLFPSAFIHGLDWTKATVQIVNTLAKTLDLPCSGHLFNLFEPDYTLQVPEKSAFVTFGCLEQIGKKHEPFVSFVLKKKPEICLNIEPINDFYDLDNLPDYLANRYHLERNYLQGFISSLEQKQSDGLIKILYKKRIAFGGRFHDGWSIVAWEPL